MALNGNATLLVENLPREVRDGLSAFCRMNKITLPILMEWVYGVVYNPHNLETISKGLETTLAKWDSAKYRGSGPWHSLKHEFGLYGIWVRIPENGQMKANGENHDPETRETTS